MTIVSTTIERILAFIANTTMDIPREDYIEVLEELKEEIEERLEVAHDAEEREALETEE